MYALPLTKTGAYRALLAAATGVACLFALFPGRFVVASERALFAIDPSAERAVAYGNRHFDATDASLYDIERAETFFRAAEAIDPAYPGVQHQLARIDFLHGDFLPALMRIDKEIELRGTENPNAYYIRALILGYQGKYLAAAADYETYFSIAPANWAGINDYAWVLLKADLPETALAALDWGLGEWPDNPWLLHNRAIALYELGRYEEAARAVAAASAAVGTLTEEGWLIAYPGNDPLLAAEGLASFRQAVEDSRARIAERLAEERANEPE